MVVSPSQSEVTTMHSPSPSTAHVTNIPTAICEKRSMIINGQWACSSRRACASAGSAFVGIRSLREILRRRFGIARNQMRPERSARLADAAALTSATSTSRIAIASCGHACTQAGASPTSQTIRAHVALPDDAKPVRILRHVIGALHRAVLAADALVIEMAHDSGFGILVVSEHRATLEAGGFEAMMASGCHRLQIWLSGFAMPVINPTSRQVSSSSSPFSE